MITKGLVSELHFISKIFNHELKIVINDNLKIIINNNNMLIFYKDIKIWNEIIEGADSHFGIESLDTISRIIVCIDNKTEWKYLVHSLPLD